MNELKSDFNILNDLTIIKFIIIIRYDDRRNMKCTALLIDMHLCRSINKNDLLKNKQ